MFTTGAFLALGIVGFLASRMNNRERMGETSVELMAPQYVIWTRQDIRLIAYELGAILIMLGVIADGVHRS